MIRVSAHVLHMKPSPTLQIKGIVERLLAEGRSVCNFGVGELNPEIRTPRPLIEAIVGALETDETHYSPSAGDPELREALSRDFRAFGLDYAPSRIVVCPGPKDALFKACLTIMDRSARRNRVVSFAPIYESFEQVPRIITGLPPVVLETDERFLPDLNRLESTLKEDDSVAAVIINSPNNPSGAVYPHEFFEDLASLLSYHEEVAVLSDEVYRTVRYDETPYASIARLMPERTLYIGGISKEVSATGLRLGWVAGPASVMEALDRIEGNTSSCVHLPTQKGLARFLEADSDLGIRRGITVELQQRRDRFVRLFRRAVPAARLESPRGAFYAFPDVTGVLEAERRGAGRFASDSELSLYLLNEAGVACLPGSSFYRPGHLRFAYALSPGDIERGVQSVGRALA